jgi:hypothetical protein
MKKYFILVSASLLFFINSGFCQVLNNDRGNILFHGLVMDANTEYPLSNSQIFINRSFISASDGEGKFAFYVNRNDTIIFRRLGYKQAIMFISDTLAGREFIAGIFLYTDTLLIGEVIIIPRLTSLKSDLMNPRVESNPEYENAKYNLAVSAYQARVSQNKLGDPATNYEVIRQKQREDAYYRGQIPPDKMIGLSPLLLIPAVYLLIKGLPEKPQPLQPQLTDYDIYQIHKKYLETLKQRK